MGAWNILTPGTKLRPRVYANTSFHRRTRSVTDTGRLSQMSYRGELSESNLKFRQSRFLGASFEFATPKLPVTKFPRPQAKRPCLDNAAEMPAGPSEEPSQTIE